MADEDIVNATFAHARRTNAAGVNPPSRRSVVGGLLGAAGLALAPGGVMAALAPTPRQSEGPFYPPALPADADNNLVRVQGRAAEALGTVTHVAGRVVGRDGAPVEGALVEIWQCDANGRYLHPGDRRRMPRDAGFQGYGRMTTAADGGYRFRTIRPVPYPGRAPHIHFAVAHAGRRLITQMYVAGAPENARDFLLNAIEDPAARASLVVALSPRAAAPRELEGRFDIVLAVNRR